VAPGLGCGEGTHASGKDAAAAATVAATGGDEDEPSALLGLASELGVWPAGASSMKDERIGGAGARYYHQLGI